MALKLDPEVAQLYCGYWENSTTFSAPSLETNIVRALLERSRFTERQQAFMLRLKKLFIIIRFQVKNNHTYR